MPLTIVFIPGYQSFVPSRKSNYLQNWCDKNQHRFITFNHDFSSANASVGTWFRYLQTVLQEQTGSDHLILIGASLGAWLAHLFLIRDEVELKLRSRIRGVLALGMSINGTEVWLNEIEPIEKRTNRTHIYRRPSAYSTSGFYDIPVAMLLDSKEYLLPMEKDSIELKTRHCILMFMHGMRDNDVPYQRVIDFVQRLQVNNVGTIELRLIQDGDHRLSRDEDLQKMRRSLHDLIEMMIHNEEVQESI